MHLAIRADGGPDIGYGHLSRSSAVAEEYLNRGHTITVATTTLQPAQEIFPDEVRTTSLPSRSDPAPFVNWLDKAIPNAVFTDAYPVDTEYQRAILDRVPLAVLQDDARHAVCADLFVNGNLYATDLDYEFVGGKPETCLGGDYVLLRSEIRNRTVNDPPLREDPERAIVTMGGSDIANLTPTIVAAFEGIDLIVDVIVGPGFSRTQEQDIRKAARNVTAEIDISRDPDNLVERMYQADFAVSTASSTTYELLALGTPIVSVPVADNQQLIADVLCDRNLATVIDKKDANLEKIRDAIIEYIKNTSIRRRRRSCGMAIVDAKGTERIYENINRVA